MEDNRLLCKNSQCSILLMKNTFCINGCCSINLTDKRNVKLNLANNQKMLPPPFLFPQYKSRRWTMSYYLSHSFCQMVSSGWAVPWPHSRSSWHFNYNSRHLKASLIFFCPGGFVCKSSIITTSYFLPQHPLR